MGNTIVYVEEGEEGDQGAEASNNHIFNCCKKPSSGDAKQTHLQLFCRFLLLKTKRGDPSPE